MQRSAWWGRCGSLEMKERETQAPLAQATHAPGRLRGATDGTPHGSVTCQVRGSRSAGGHTGVLVSPG